MSLKGCTRPVRVGALATVVFAVVAVAGALAQTSDVVRSDLRVIGPRVRPVAAPSATAAPTAAPSGALGAPRVRVPILPRLNQAPSVVPGQQVPLSMLPPLRHGERRPFSATGATITVTTSSGCNSTIGTIYNVGCTVSWTASGLPSCSSGSCHQDYWIDANASSATAIGTAYSGTTGSARSTTLSHSGTYVFASLNSNTNNWDAIVYVTAGSATYFNTYTDSSDKNAATTFTASSGNTVYVYASGLTPTDLYVVYVESTSITGQCAYIAPTANPTPGPTLCNPANSPGENAIGGIINVQWPLSTSYTTGTYSIVLYDLTTSTRLAQREVALVGSAATSSWSITPTGGNSSPAPAPAGTPGSIFAFNGTLDESDKSLTAKATGLNNAHTYRYAVSDPNGLVVSTGTLAPTSGAISTTFTATQAESPENYLGHTYTISLYDQSATSMVTTKAFDVLGYNMQSQFTSPVGTALAISAGGSSTSGVTFTNSGDSVWGVGNGDTIRELQLDAGGVGVTIDLDANATSCGTNCTTETETDSAGNSWTVTDVRSGNGSNADSTITLTPVSSTTTLPIGGTITVPNMVFNNTVGSHCSSGCTMTTSILPTDGLTWSSTTAGLAGNSLYITNGFGNTYSATGHVKLIGETLGGTFTATNDVHGFAPNETSALYDSAQPFSPTGTPYDVLAYTVNNTSSAGSGNITAMQITFPSNFTTSSIAIDSTSPSTWTKTTCPTGTASNVICIVKAGSNAGIAANGGTETIYFDVPAPTTSFTYTDLGGTVTAPANFSVAADGTQTVWAGSVASVDTTALAGFSLDYTKITPLVSPQNVGSNTSQSVTFSVQNASTAADVNPDYLDAIIISVPTANGLTSISSTTAGWSYLGSSVSGSNTFYWFGECAAQYSTSNGPAANPPPATSASLPNCGQASEYAYSIAPSASASFSATIAAGSSAISMTEYAHGANGDGWSKGTSFSLGVNTLAVSSGFTKVGTYGSPSVVGTNTTPQTSADTSTTFGNSYVYEVKNLSSSSSGQNVTGFTITIPGTDTSSANGTDSAGINWTITAAPTVTMSGGASGCSVQSYTSATSGGANGSIVVGGGSCSIPPSGIVDVNFSAKAPYKINDTYKFGTVYTGGNPACSSNCTASEAWFSDTDVQVVLSANLIINVDPSGSGPGGSNPTPNCPSCTFTTSSIDLGTIANGQTVTATDVLTVSVYTDAATQDGWALYASVNSNPANTGSPTNELLMDVDQTASNQGGTGLTFDSTTMTVIPTSGLGTKLVDTGSGATARRLPYDAVMNYQVSIQGGPTTAQTSTVTFTFIAQ